MANLLTSSAVLALGTLALNGAQIPHASPCQPSGPLARIESLPEASGVAASRRTPGVYWAHNDSGDPVIFALDEQGAIKGRVRVTGARVDDWEDIAVGRCASGWCLYLADIGDNSGKREHITVYRVAEPAPGDVTTAQVDVFDATYPDGAADAEAMFATGGSVFIVTKGDPGPVALYRLPGLDAGRKMRLERVGEPLATGEVAAKDRPTAADVSQDGRWVAIRTTHYVSFYRTEELTSGRWREAFRADVSALGERRGEGLTFTAGGDVVLVGEAGGVLRGPGTFARIACNLQR